MTTPSTPLPAIPGYGRPRPLTAERYVDVLPDGGLAMPVLEFEPDRAPRNVRVVMQHPTGRVIFDDAGETRLWRLTGPDNVARLWFVLAPPLDILPVGTTRLRVLARIPEFSVWGGYRSVEQSWYLRFNDPTFARPSAGAAGWVGGESPGAARVARGETVIPEGASEMVVTFPIHLTVPPQVVLVSVQADGQADVQLVIAASVVADSATETGFTVRFTTPPNTGGYVLSWAAWL